MNRWILALLVLALPAEAAVTPIRMIVEQSSKTVATKTTSSKGKTNTAASPSAGGTQVRSLLIKLENHSKDTFDNLIVKYWFFGRDAKSHDVKPVQAGQRKSFLGPNSRETVDSETVSIQYTPEHSEMAKGNSGKGKSGKGRKGRGTTSRKVPASGTKLTGYAVQVFHGGSIVAEDYSEDSYKAKVGTAPPSLTEPKKPKPAAKFKKPKAK